MQTYDIKTISINDPDFPSDIAQIGNKAQTLYYMGNRALLSGSPRLGIVGTRKPTPYGRQVTIEMAQAASRGGAIIVSGLAHGIDGIAHKAMVEVGGQGIAVLPSPLNAIYPRAHRGLAQKILENNGLLVTQYPSGTPQLPYMFVARNSIVAALSETLLITEAAHGSGSRHTFENALDINRQTACVPGNITSVQSAGTNEWIRSGAGQGVQIITSPSDLSLLLKLNESFIKPKIVPKNNNEHLIIEALKDSNLNVTELQKTTQLEIANLNLTLTMLEIQCAIEKMQDTKWRIKV